MTASTSKPGRRTLVKGAAWSVPAVAVASAAPSQAQSLLPVCVQAEYSGGACKCPGAGNAWSYFLGFCFTNTCTEGEAITITITGLENNAGKPFDPNVTSPAQFVLSPGQKFCTNLTLHTSTSSAAKVRIFYNLNDVAQGYFELDAPPDCAAGVCPSDG